MGEPVVRHSKGMSVDVSNTDTAEGKKTGTARRPNAEDDEKDVSSKDDVVEVGPCLYLVFIFVDQGVNGTDDKKQQQL